MYNIGYIDLSGTNSDQYIKVLSKECKLTRYDTSVFEECPVDIDGFLILDGAGESFFQISDFILKIRKQSKTFIWIVSQRLDNIAKVVFLKMGADDNFCKEQTLEEFYLKILNSLKRKQGTLEKHKFEMNRISTKIENKYERIHLDDSNLSLTLNGQDVELTNIEFKVMAILIKKRGQTVTYEELYKAVWGQSYSGINYKIANIIFHIREKIEKAGLDIIFIKTIRSKGYILM
ncbi:winged helix-turn-helix transcriptional regulator [Enterococcus ureasiticus]|uniref:OmpR/PhoB-type domain-containing protein n=1 Tax=Enterococcus ureasiticus TaxID=903984 RepID=A0A1E5GAD5_9ENTE|nr:response regulator transcription factor [Enterococcus ureasiticus]OEG09653.1 hypothetical protein BCR21_15030 [Enterococcus ureasiticus]